MKLDHTLTEAFKKFDLIAGVGDGSYTACAMTMLSWICGEEWSDHPPCAHRLIADIVIRANDAKDTTPKMRRELVRAGRTGVLDTWWIPTEVVVEMMAGEDQTPFSVAVRMLANISAWKKTKTKPYLTGADLIEAYLAWADLTGVDLTRAYLTRANLAAVDFTGANLTGADLTGAYLTRAYLTRANLAEADLTGADLTRANLAEANLTGADLTRADLAEADLIGARGMPLNGMPDSWGLQNGQWIRA